MPASRQPRLISGITRPLQEARAHDAAPHPPILEAALAVDAAATPRLRELYDETFRRGGKVMIMERRDQVLIGRRSLPAIAASTFLIR